MTQGLGLSKKREHSIFFWQEKNSLYKWIGREPPIVRGDGGICTCRCLTHRIAAIIVCATRKPMLSIFYKIGVLHKSIGRGHASCYWKTRFNFVPFLLSIHSRQSRTIPGFSFLLWWHNWYTLKEIHWHQATYRMEVKIQSDPSFLAQPRWAGRTNAQIFLVRFHRGIQWHWRIIVTFPTHFI